MHEGLVETRTPVKTPPKGADANPSSEKSEKTPSSNREKDDKNVEKATGELKTEVEKLKWEKHNFENFDASSLEKITSKPIIFTLFE